VSERERETVFDFFYSITFSTIVSSRRSGSISIPHRNISVSVTGPDKPGVLQAFLGVFDSFSVELVDLDQIVLSGQVLLFTFSLFHFFLLFLTLSLTQTHTLSLFSSLSLSLSPFSSL
jgi:hypothetical protein